MTMTVARTAWERFVRECQNRLWVETGLPQTVWERSIELTQRFGPALGVRMLDSLHVACALELRAQSFWTFDERQERLAIAAGLMTNP
jgi:hypothetical protein